MDEFESRSDDEEAVELRDAAVEALQSAARQSDPREFDRLTRLGLGLIERAQVIRQGRRAVSRSDGAPEAQDDAAGRARRVDLQIVGANGGPGAIPDLVCHELKRRKSMDMTRRATAEFFGTLWLVFGGCGAAVLAAAFPSLGIGFLGVAFAFGLTVLTMAYAVGHISGGHFNPAVTIGVWAGGRFKAADVLPYIIAQVIGAIVAAGVLT